MLCAYPLIIDMSLRQFVANLKFDLLACHKEATLESIKTTINLSDELIVNHNC